MDYLIGLFVGIIMTGAYFIWFLRSLVKGGYAIFEATPKLTALLKKDKP